MLDVGNLLTFWGSFWLVNANFVVVAAPEEGTLSKAEEILQALGGSQNVEIVEPCLTRLRVEVVDPTKVDNEALTDAGAFGVVQVESTVQVVVGPTAEDLAEQINGVSA